MKHIDALCCKNTGPLNAKACGIYNYYSAVTLYVRTGKQCPSNLNTITAERENNVPVI
jgi:hypothetical protein